MFFSSFHSLGEMGERGRERKAKGGGEEERERAGEGAVSRLTIGCVFALALHTAAERLHAGRSFAD